MNLTTKLFAFGLLLWTTFLVSVSAVAASSAPFSDTASVHQLKQVSGLKDRLKNQERVRVIIEVRDPLNNASSWSHLSDTSPANPQQQILPSGLQHAKAQLNALMSQNAKTKGRPFSYLPLMVAEVDQTELNALLASPYVAGIEEDRLSEPFLERSASIIGANRVWAEGNEGQGWSVAVLDTGVEGSHPFLANRIVAEACFSTTSEFGSTSLCPSGQRGETGPGAASDCYGLNGCGHGTHVSGTVVGQNSDFKAIAAQANLIGVQVFSRFDSEANCGTGRAPCVLSWTSDQIAALEYVYSLRNTHNIASVNMSLGGGRFYDQASCDANNSVMRSTIGILRNAGIATVIAAGNSGFSDSLGSPGCVTGAISVGSTLSMYGQTNSCANGNNVDAVSCFSNSANFLDLLAPGHFIYAPDLNQSYSFKAGTSMAAPHVAACMALLRVGAEDASVDTLLNALKETGQPIVDQRNNITFSRIDCFAASQYLRDNIQEPVSLGAALDNETLNWSSTSSATWFGQNQHFIFGVSAAQSGFISHNQQSNLVTSVSGPGILRFSWKVSSESNYDFLQLLVNGVQRQQISGFVDWQEVSIELGAGEHELTWRYVKDGSVNSGLDAGWVDNVRWQSNITHLVQTSAGSGGGIAPSSQFVSQGTTAAFTINSEFGYQIASVSGCGGTLTGSTYTTAAITGPCTVTASFTLKSYTVNFVDWNGQVLKTEQVLHGGNALAPVAPSRVGHDFTGWNISFDNVISDLNIVAQYTARQFVVTATVVGNGTATPVSQSIAYGSRAQLMLKPNSGFKVVAASGCGGIFSGQLYVTAPITENCEVTAYFEERIKRKNNLLLFLISTLDE